jgi:hypothetical protein
MRPGPAAGGVCLSDEVKVCKECGAVCLPFNRICNRCEANVSDAELISLRELVKREGDRARDDRGITPSAPPAME